MMQGRRRYMPGRRNTMKMTQEAGVDNAEEASPMKSCQSGGPLPPTPTRSATMAAISRCEGP
jgi:hypothetical protein